MKFNELELNEKLLKNIDNLKYTEMTQIQEKVIPEILKGHDVLVKAQTGSGKTASYLVPIINSLIKHKDEQSTKAIILVPTRDLVNQVYDSFEKLNINIGLTACKVMGGADKQNQIEEIKKRPDVIIAVTGRFKDMMARDIVIFKEVKYFVLDEVDKMLDLGFRSDIFYIYQEASKQTHDFNTLMLSATMPTSIMELSTKFLKPGFKNIDSEEKVVINELIQQRFLVMHSSHVMTALLKLVRENNVRTIIFANKINQCSQIEALIRYLGIQAASINGDRTQTYRDNVIRDFKESKISVLVATDLMSRGIDIKDLDLVINLGLPEKLETYMHRIGRVGRANSEGRAFTICALEEKEKMERLIKEFNLKAKVIEKESWSKPAKENIKGINDLYYNK